MEGVLRFKSWFLNAPGLIHGGAYYRNFTVYIYSALLFLTCLRAYFAAQGWRGCSGDHSAGERRIHDYCTSSTWAPFGIRPNKEGKMVSSLDTTTLLL